MSAILKLPDIAASGGPFAGNTVPLNGPQHLTEVFNAFDRWFHMTDKDALLTTLGTVAAHSIAGDPVWLLLVGTPGSGKTEILNAVRTVHGIHAAATLTESALLSGSPKRDRGSDSTGGLLRKIGDRGLILCKDFGSVLSMHRDARAAVLAALREVFDGSWTRHVGVDGGKTLHWEGHVGFVGGCTPAIDQAHAVNASLGERFLLLRLPDTEQDLRADAALRHSGHEADMRRELATLVASFFAGLKLPDSQRELETDERKSLVDLAELVALCRSAVVRDGYLREIEDILGAESPTRLAVSLAGLFNGLLVVGLGRVEAWRIVRRVALDSMPRMRRRALESLLRLAGVEDTATTSRVAEAMNCPTNTVRRALEDLNCYGIVHRETADKSGKADLWRIGRAGLRLVPGVLELRCLASDGGEGRTRNVGG